MAAHDDHNNNSNNRDNANNNIDVQALTSSLLRSPDFQNALRSAINSQTLSGSSLPQSQSTPSQFETPSEERRNLFPYYGGQYQQGRQSNMSSTVTTNTTNVQQQRRYSPYTRNTQATTPSSITTRGGRYRANNITTSVRNNFSGGSGRRHHHRNGASNQKPPYHLKEVILLTEQDRDTIIRAPKKAELSGKGLVCNNVDIDRSLNQDQIYDLFSNLFKEYLDRFTWNEGDKRFIIKMGIGHNLVEPRLTESATLDAENMHRLFGQKIVWLVPTQHLTEPEDLIMCENCHLEFQHEIFLNHIVSCGGGSSRHTDSGTTGRTITDYFEPEETATFVKNDETKSTLMQMFPNASMEAINETMSSTANWEEAVDLLTSHRLMSGAEVIKAFIEKNLAVNSEKILEISREDIWRESLRFYKIASVDKTQIFQRFRIIFKNEVGVDVGALSIEFFTKFFSCVRNELFESVPSEKFLIPKRSGGNLTLFKLFGIALAHSFLQGGPPFPFLHPWCYSFLTGQTEEEIVSLLSREEYRHLIPLNAGTANVLGFLDGLVKCKTDAQINELFDASEGPAYEQIVNSSQWPVTTKINMTNIEALKSMVVWEELVVKREKQLNALKQGLEYVGLLQSIQAHPMLLMEYFVPNNEGELTPARMLELIKWDDSDHVAYGYLKRFITESDTPQLEALLKFATSHSMVTSLTEIEIKIELLDPEKVLLEAQACFSKLFLPVAHESYDKFKKFVKVSLDYGSEGYGNL